MKAKRVTHQGHYLLRLIRGEKIPDTIIAFCEKEKIQSGTFSGVGALQNTRVGWYDFRTKQYGSKEYPEVREVAAMTGNIALVNGKPFLHAHVVLSDTSENKTIGGHLFEAEVAVTLEIFLIAFNEPVSRAQDNDIGLKLLDI